MKNPKGLFSLLTLVFVLSSCLQANSPKKGKTSVNPSSTTGGDLIIDDDDDNDNSVVLPPTVATLEEVEAMADDSSLKGSQLSAITDSLKAALLNSIDKKGTDYAPEITASDVYTRLALSFRHKELKDAVVDQLRDLEVLDDPGVTCSVKTPNCVACIYSCTFTSKVGYSLSAHREYLSGISGVTLASTNLTFVLTSAATQRIKTAINELADKNALIAQEKEAARVIKCDKLNAMVPIKQYSLTNSANNRNSKNLVYSLSAYLSSANGYTLEADSAFTAYNSANGYSIPIYQQRNNGRLLYRPQIAAGWTNDGAVFYALAGAVDVSDCANPPAGKAWTIKRTIPVVELHRSVTVRDNNRNVSVIKRMYYPDAYFPAENPNIQSLTRAGWVYSHQAFYIPIPY